MFYEILSTKITFQFNLHFIFLLLGLQGVPYYLKIPLCVLWHRLISKRILQETGDWDISLSNVFKRESINKVNKFWLWISCRTVVQNNLSVAKTPCRNKWKVTWIIYCTINQKHLLEVFMTIILVISTIQNLHLLPVSSLKKFWGTILLARHFAPKFAVLAPPSSKLGGCSQVNISFVSTLTFGNNAQYSYK